MQKFTKNLIPESMEFPGTFDGEDVKVQLQKTCLMLQTSNSEIRIEHNNIEDIFLLDDEKTFEVNFIQPQILRPDKENEIKSDVQFTINERIEDFKEQYVHHQTDPFDLIKELQRELNVKNLVVENLQSEIRVHEVIIDHVMGFVQSYEEDIKNPPKVEEDENIVTKCHSCNPLEAMITKLSDDVQQEITNLEVLKFDRAMSLSVDEIEKDQSVQEEVQQAEDPDEKVERAEPKIELEPVEETEPAKVEEPVEKKKIHAEDLRGINEMKIQSYERDLEKWTTRLREIDGKIGMSNDLERIKNTFSKKKKKKKKFSIKRIFRFNPKKAMKITSTDHLQSVAHPLITREKKDIEMGVVKIRNKILELKYPEDFVKSIFHKDVSRWTSLNVKQWLQSPTFESEPEIAATYFKKYFQCMTGSEVEKIQENDLRKLGIISLGIRKKFVNAITYLRTSRVYNFRQHTVLSKIRESFSSLRLEKFMDNSSQTSDWSLLSRALSDVETMKETYLNVNFVGKTMLSMLPETDMDHEFVNEEEYRTYENEAIPVRLVLMESLKTSNFQSGRNFFSPSFNHIKAIESEKEMEFFRNSLVSGLIVGDFLLQWYDNSLCVPRKVASVERIAQTEPICFIKESKYQDVIQRVAEVVCHWNGKMQYKRIRKPDEFFVLGNSQNFVDNVLKKLRAGDGNLEEITINTHGALAKTLAAIRSHGQSKMAFSPSMEFQDEFDIRYTEFESHDFLDEFVHKILKHDEKLAMTKFMDEFLVLKYFDNIFWMKFKMCEENQIECGEFMPSKKTCPFE